MLDARNTKPLYCRGYTKNYVRRNDDKNECGMSPISSGPPTSLYQEMKHLYVLSTLWSTKTIDDILDIGKNVSIPVNIAVLICFEINTFNEVLEASVSRTLQVSKDLMLRKLFLAFSQLSFNGME